MTIAASAWRELWLPAASAVAAAVTLVLALGATLPGARTDPAVATPERAAEAFAAAYSARDYATAARLAAGTLQRALEHKARDARRQGGERSERGQLVIDESVLLARNRLRFTGTLIPEGEAEANGRPVSITVARHGDAYLAEAIQWPKGAPPDE